MGLLGIIFTIMVELQGYESIGRTTAHRQNGYSGTPNNCEVFIKELASRTLYRVYDHYDKQFYILSEGRFYDDKGNSYNSTYSDDKGQVFYLTI